jgi:hypothetical protein
VVALGAALECLIYAKKRKKRERGKDGDKKIPFPKAFPYIISLLSIPFFEYIYFIY